MKDIYTIGILAGMGPQVDIVVDGKEYTLGFNKYKLGQLYPK
ncbi:hypothetical protein SAMN05444487_107155 [Marininema mesophilum]|uniref:Uncharacterized protein n=1 Tax=Marininema mesophilum TaxID=1048340 RepID=A0A1H2XBP7_9BACL|nr:hypothetical protein [Marininema mesophilum]SDW90235.1 hypothetical protein SAMN05444487_107155 [Marininema mesophilum]